MIVATGVVRPYPGETSAGDAFVVEATQRGLLLALIDALGHGPHAAAAARVASETIRGVAQRSPAEVLEVCHRALHRGRGAAISVIAVDHLGNGTFAGVGNVRARLCPDSMSGPVLLAAPGVVGHKMRPVKEIAFRLSIDGIGVLHSDGVSSRVDPLGHERKTMVETAASLLASYANATDDASLLLFARHDSPRFRAG